MGYSIGASEYVDSIFGILILPSLTYGVNMTLVSLTLSPLWKRRKADSSSTRATLKTIYFVQISVLCTLLWIISCIEESNSLIALVDLSQGKEGSLGGVKIRAKYAADILYVILTLLTDTLMVGFIWVSVTSWKIVKSPSSCGGVGCSMLTVVDPSVGFPGFFS